MTSPAPAHSPRTTIIQALTRPYPVRLPMVVLVLLVPLYLFIPDLTPVRTLYVPELPWDRLVPLQPGWSLVYGALYAFLILLPVIVVRREEQIRRTVLAYLSVWTTAYCFFLIFPTTAPRPVEVIGQGFGAWGLRSLYGADPPYNCFPSLHVAHSFVSALTCYRVHRGVGVAALGCASLVALSTLFSKQHYIADVLAGAFLAVVAYALFLRTDREEISELERRAAPVLALATSAVAGVGLAGFWVIYRLSEGT